MIDDAAFTTRLFRHQRLSSIQSYLHCRSAHINDPAPLTISPKFCANSPGNIVLVPLLHKMRASHKIFRESGSGLRFDAERKRAVFERKKTNQHVEGNPLKMHFEFREQRLADATHTFIKNSVHGVVPLLTFGARYLIGLD